MAVAGVRVIFRVMLTLAIADLVVSLVLVAVIVTVAGLGTKLGALQSPFTDIVPVVLLPPTMLFTDQFTDEL